MASFRPPKPNNNADFIVTVFVMLVATILILLTITAIFLSIFTKNDVSPFFVIILEMVKALIAALVGFLAGKASVEKKE